MAELDIAAIKKQAEASTHRRLDALPRPVCLECQQPWPCDACQWTAIALVLVEALEEARGKASMWDNLTAGKSLDLQEIRRRLLAYGAVLEWIGSCSCKHCPEIRRILSKEEE